MKTNEAISLFRQHMALFYPSSEIDAMMRVIMEEVMHYSPVDVVMRANDELPNFFTTRLGTIISRLERNEPLQYILGFARLHGHNFKVTTDTLIPRPETEQLVDIIIDENGERDDLNVIDLGTGSGCIAMSLARALKFATVTGTDINIEALNVAHENASALKVKVKWLEADMLEMPPMPDSSFDIIVSNPPYITTSEKATMEPNVLNYEPHSALFVPDSDPLLYYRAIALFAMHTLKNGGRLYLEINQHQGEATAELLKKAGLSDVVLRRDFFGNQRFVTATKTH